MLRILYRLLIAPRQPDEDTRNREIVLNILLTSTLCILLLAVPLFLHSIFVMHQDYALRRMGWVLAVLFFVMLLVALSRARRYRISAFLLVAMYFLMAAGLVYQWGVTIPVAILLFGLVIVLAGILLGPLYSLYSAALVIVTLFLVEIATLQEFIHPDLSWTVDKPRIGDVVGFAFIFIIIAVVSWLFNYQMENSLHRAERAEKALQRQKASLEKTVTERTHQLQIEQLEKVQHMYRFAELGQLSTALLHELANHLTTLTLDIEGLKGENRSDIMQRAKRSIRYIDDMVHRVRDQLHGKSQPQNINIVDEINNVMTILQHKALSARVSLVWQPPLRVKRLACRGEPVRFRQMVANLVSNAIEAYAAPAETSDSGRVVLITADVRGKQIILTFTDWGVGIGDEQRAKLFDPFFSTKKTGMGMGLFIAKQIAEEHFGGRLRIDKTKEHTAFVVKLTKAA